MREILITKDSYAKTFEELFNSFGINQSYILQTKIELPFEIPVPDGYLILSPFDEKNSYWSMLYFTSKALTSSYTIFDHDSVIKSRRTVVNLCVIGKEFHFGSYKSDYVDFNLSNKYSFFFDKSLEHLNAVILAYSIHFQDEYVYELTK